MNKETLQEMITLTQECLTRFWQLDVEFPIKYFHKDIVWIGSAQSQFTEGYEDTAADYRSIAEELVPCHLLRQEFTAVQNVGNACTIAGKYLTTTDDEADYFLQVQQRCTFVWEIMDGKPVIKHCHISNPMGELKLAEGERVPNALGKMANQYVMQEMAYRSEGKRIVLPGEVDVVRFLAPFEIIHVSAKGRSCIVHTINGDAFYARISITDFPKIGGSSFVAVHRSHVINLRYISEIRKFKVTLMDGTVLPVPEKRYIRVREMLKELHGFFDGNQEDFR